MTGRAIVDAIQLQVSQVVTTCGGHVGMQWCNGNATSESALSKSYSALSLWGGLNSQNSAC